MPSDFDGQYCRRLALRTRSWRRQMFQATTPAPIGCGISPLECLSARVELHSICGPNRCGLHVSVWLRSHPQLRARVGSAKRELAGRP